HRAGRRPDPVAQSGLRRLQRRKRCQLPMRRPTNRGMDSVTRVPEPPPYRPIAFAPVDIACDAVPGGGFRLRSRVPLAPHDPSLGLMFRAAVEAHPDRAFLAERAGSGWRTLTYAACRPIVDAIAAAFLERGLSAERPVMVLSGNSIDHALLMLAAYTAG